MRCESILQAEYQAKVRMSDGTIVAARVRCFDDSTIHFDDPCRLVLNCGDKEIQASAGDFFEALDLVRSQLEREGSYPLVNGVGLGRYPSEMARNMGSGLFVYRLQLGTRVTTADLLDTFGSSDLTEPVTVLEQRRFYEQWIRSCSNVDDNAKLSASTSVFRS